MIRLVNHEVTIVATKPVPAQTGWLWLGFGYLQGRTRQAKAPRKKMPASRDTGVFSKKAT
jgi:hypothetical protein